MTFSSLPLGESMLHLSLGRSNLELIFVVNFNLSFAISNGYVNLTELVENTCQSKETTERKLIVKTYAGNIMGRLLNVVNSSTPLEQSLIAYEASRIGVSPRLFGADDKGRIEEYIDCRTLGHEEAFESEIAIAFAKFHSSKVPVTRDRCLDRERGDLARMRKTYDKISSIATRKGFTKSTIESILQELEWFERINTGVKHRTVLVTGDPNYMNILVLNSPKDHQSPVMLIDFDCSCYSWRGIELGGHFVCQLVNFKDFTDLKTDFSYPDESTQCLFLNTYLNEWKRLNEGLVDESMDCVENLLKESYIGAMFMCLLWSWFHYCVHDDFENFGEDFFNQEPGTWKMFLAMKNFFQEKYLQSTSQEVNNCVN